MTVAVGVGTGTVGVTIGRMLARGVALLPGEGLDLLPGDCVLGVGRMLAVGGSDKLELIRKPSLEKCAFELKRLKQVCTGYIYLPLSWAGLFRDIFLCSEDLVCSPA